MARLVYLNVQQAGGQGGGAIISHRHILTNAFVLGNQFTTLNVFIGSTTRANQRQVGVQTRIPHLNYQGNPRLNDIGIIMLNADIVFDRFTQPIALAGVGQNWPYLNEQGAALGFGGFPTQINQRRFSHVCRKTFLICFQFHSKPSKCFLAHCYSSSLHYSSSPARSSSAVLR